MNSVSSSPAFYALSAEYVAVLLGPAWEALGPGLAAALDGLDPAVGPMVDVGAGSGLSTRALAAAVPRAEILAVEPDRALRTALLAGVVADPDLRSRVTVLDTDLLSADLPGRLGGLIAMNVLGHFSPGDRQRLWALLAARLAPAGRAVFDLYPPYESQAISAAAMGEVVVGRRRYSGTAAAEPAGAEAVTWEMTYTVEQEGRRVTQLSARQHWYVATPERLGEELAEHRLRLSRPDGAASLFIVEHAVGASADDAKR